MTSTMPPQTAQQATVLVIFRTCRRIRESTARRLWLMSRHRAACHVTCCECRATLRSTGSMHFAVRTADSIGPNQGLDRQANMHGVGACVLRDAGVAGGLLRQRGMLAPVAAQGLARLLRRGHGQPYPVPLRRVQKQVAL